MGVVGDTVYLVGGASTRTLLDIVEKWDGTNWTRCAPLNIARSDWMTHYFGEILVYTYMIILPGRGRGLLVTEVAST